MFGVPTGQNRFSGSYSPGHWLPLLVVFMACHILNECPIKPVDRRLGSEFSMAARRARLPVGTASPSSPVDVTLLLTLEPSKTGGFHVDFGRKGSCL